MERDNNKKRNKIKKQANFPKSIAIEKSLILIQKYIRTKQFYSAPKIILHFGGTNNICINCIMLVPYLKQNQLGRIIYFMT